MEFGKFFKPMLLDEKMQSFDSEDYLYEMKFDGYRAIVHASPKEIYVYSRNGINLLVNFPELKSIQHLVKDEVIFDGEVVAFKDDLPSFSMLQQRGRVKSLRLLEKYAKENPVVFVAFDCLYEKGKSLIEKPLWERKRILDKYHDGDNFVKVSYVLKNGKDLFKKVKRMNLEGIVAKGQDSKYYPESRSKEWIKIKNYKMGEFFIGGYVETEFKRLLLLGEYHKDGKFYFVGKVSVDKCMDFHSKKVKKSAFCNYEEDNCIYFKPSEVCKVMFIERTEGNNLREPVFKGMVS